MTFSGKCHRTLGQRDVAHSRTGECSGARPCTQLRDHARPKPHWLFHNICFLLYQRNTPTSAATALKPKSRDTIDARAWQASGSRVFLCSDSCFRPSLWRGCRRPSRLLWPCARGGEALCGGRRHVPAAFQPGRLSDPDPHGGGAGRRPYARARAVDEDGGARGWLAMDAWGWPAMD
eukprot:6179144-Pleurochrysis_carterae.AAC.1